jgi:phosphoesterase RecJ-like protein
MDQAIALQVYEQIKRAGKILIVLPENLDADSVASGLAMKRFLDKIQKETVIASAGEVPLYLKFLPGASVIEKKLETGKNLIISVDVRQKVLDEVSYEKSGEKVQIFLKAQGAQFDESDLSFSREKMNLDLIIALEGGSLDDFGKIFEQSPDRFFETPKINIDHKPGNQYFGTINLVDITATSTAEILTDLFQKYDPQLIDEDMATCLLAGIIEKTGSFQRIQTTPKAFLKASELIALGGRQQEIIKNIFKTKSLSLLKLWGRALAKMKILEFPATAYSVLNFTDFEKSQSSPSDLFSVLREFTDNLSGYKILGLLWEDTGGAPQFLLALHEQIPATKLLEVFPGARLFNFSLGNYRLVEFSALGKTLENLEADLLAIIKTLPG